MHSVGQYTPTALTNYVRVKLKVVSSSFNLLSTPHAVTNTLLTYPKDTTHNIPVYGRSWPTFNKHFPPSDSRILQYSVSVIRAFAFRGVSKRKCVSIYRQRRFDFLTALLPKVSLLRCDTVRARVVPDVSKVSWAFRITGPNMLSHNPEGKSSAQNSFSVFICVVSLNFAVSKDFVVEKIQRLSS